MDSILTSLKKLLGMDEDNHEFDTDIILHANSIFGILKQIGVGPEEGFVVTNEYSKWSDFIQDNNNIEFVRSYVYLKLKLIFDPPINSAVIKSIEESIKELEWRLSTSV